MKKSTVNNGIQHDYTNQCFVTELTGSSFYFPSTANENSLRGLFIGKDVILFNIKETDNDVDVIVSIPDGFDCVHYWKGKVTSKTESKNAHLTYHGRRKRKKATGEIHVISDGMDPLSGKCPYTESHISSSSNIRDHPLPICRIELSKNPGSVVPKKAIINYFHTDIPHCFFNTLEIHLAKKGYLRTVADPTPRNDPWRSLFIYNSMHTFFLKKIERRPGFYPQVLALQTRTFELIIMATREYKNLTYKRNSVKYFHTRDYFRELGKRKVIECQGGYFIDRSPNEPTNPEAKLMLDYLNIAEENKSR